ncbi:MAG: Ldh family oxidoreductase [Candidatus Handelsmanbacteria bacterium]|nr:Ldh family oxidoreductase [Candidatus Handelsmanbacteria bacterium]
MPAFRPEDLNQLGAALFTAVGVPPAEAALVADHLVESSLLGHDSHGPLRFPQYVEMVRQGTVVPGAPVRVLRATRCLAQLSGNWNFGPVSAEAAMRMALELSAQAPLVVVTLKDCNHVARLGRFAALAAGENRIALVAANGHGGDLAVAPFGGIERRLPTNPLCLALPTQRPWPLVLDMTTSAISGGALRLHHNTGTPTPPDRLVDATGQPTTDTKAYYGPPPGAMLSLGFPGAGHKGFGLALMVDILAGALSGAGCSQASPERSGNALFIALIDIAAFTPLDSYHRESEQFIDWIKSSPPAQGVAEVLLPGEQAWRVSQERLRQGIGVDERAWAQISALAAELRVDLPNPL